MVMEEEDRLLNNLQQQVTTTTNNNEEEKAIIHTAGEIRRQNIVAVAKSSSSSSSSSSSAPAEGAAATATRTPTPRAAIQLTTFCELLPTCQIVTSIQRSRLPGLESGCGNNHERIQSFLRSISAIILKKRR
ncbi:MAG TPA: hypothetical protein VFZ67_00820 [Nitrososphaera sp.]